MLQVDTSGAGLEQRLAALQAQIDALRQVPGHDDQPHEHRLSLLAEQSASILRQWAATADRHARAVTQLENQLRELGDAGTRVQEDAAGRLQELERVVQQEWTALRELHEAPVRQLVEQAASLTEVCVAAANSAQHGFDRAEARIATLEADVHRATSELTRELQAVLAEVRHLSVTASRQLPGENAAWPLEGVTRLHQQLRESSAGARALPASASAAEVPAGPVPLSNVDGVAPHEEIGDAPSPGVHRGEAARAGGNSDPEAATRTDTDESDDGVEASAASRLRPRSRPAAGGWWRRPMAIAAAIVVAVGVFAWRLQRDAVTARQQVEEASRQSQLAAQAALREAAERQLAADRQLGAARDLAARAQTIGDVLAAPDLLRYSLVGAAALPGARGQVLWSRTRGFVFSASGLPAPAPGMAYQAWLLTRAGPVSAATFVPDDAGRATVTTAPALDRGVYGVVVTTERREGAASPTSDPVLLRVTVPAPVAGS